MSENENQDKTLDKCPKCGSELSRWLNPDDSSWGRGYQMVCFSDECPYYISGWKWMKERYAVNASYRYRFNPENGSDGPLPVYSPVAGRGNIVQEEEQE